MSEAGQKSECMIIKLPAAPELLPSSRVSNLSRSYAWRANALTTRTPLRFSCSTVERVASCSWYFSYAFETRLKKKYEMTMTSGTTMTESQRQLRRSAAAPR